jgi:hypothetical protein
MSGKIFRAEVFEDLAACGVLGVEVGDAHASRSEGGGRRQPAPSRVLLLRGVENSENRSVAGDRQSQIAPPSDVSGEDLDGYGFVSKTSRELREAGEFRRDQAERSLEGVR